MKQPILVINKNKVREIIEHQLKFTRIPYSLEWGHFSSIEEIFESLDKEHADGEYLRMHRVYTALYRRETHKMIAHANRMLDRVWQLCKLYREDLNKILVDT